MKNFLILTLLLLLASCSVSKRHYRKGFHVDWAHRAGKPQKEITHQSTPSPSSETEQNQLIASTLQHDESNVLADASASTPKLLKKNKWKLNEPTCGDVIYFRNGNQVTAKVLEISQREIRYKRCDNIDGPLMVIDKDDVEFIRFQNGTTEKFEKHSLFDHNKKELANGKKRTHPMAIAAIIMAGLSLFIPLIAPVLGIIFASFAEKDIRAKPHIYQGETLARVAMIISIAFLCMLLVLLVYFLFMFILFI